MIEKFQGDMKPQAIQNNRLYYIDVPDSYVRVVVYRPQHSGCWGIRIRNMSANEVEELAPATLHKRDHAVDIAMDAAIFIAQELEKQS